MINFRNTNVKNMFSFLKIFQKSYEFNIIIIYRNLFEHLFENCRATRKINDDSNECNTNNTNFSRNISFLQHDFPIVIASRIIKYLVKFHFKIVTPAGVKSLQNQISRFSRLRTCDNVFSSPMKVSMRRKTKVISFVPRNKTTT